MGYLSKRVQTNLAKKKKKKRVNNCSRLFFIFQGPALN